MKSLPPQWMNATWTQKTAYLISTTGCTGHWPVSGTWGALVAWALHTWLFPRALTLAQWPVALTILLGVTVIGILCAESTERLTGVKDDPRVNVDEVAGYFWAVLFLPAGWQYTVPAFFLARVFDILKPPPAYRFQHLPGGVGIMLDDLIASLYALGVMHGICYWFG
ncbi:MAG TPA: phosphatidylglycerophosphatase A [bacterium]|nr:phosphatidylglycerophosphatase A [bacterium]